MKILQVNASYKPAYVYGGPTMSVSRLSEQLIKAGCTIYVYTTAANGLAELPVSCNIQTIIDNVPVIYFERITKDHTHFSPTLLKHLWKEVKDFDVVHIHAWWNLVSVLSCWIAITRGIPVVISPRGTLSRYSFDNKNSLAKQILHNLFGKWLLNKSSFHVTSEQEKQAIEAIISHKRIATIYNFVNVPEISTHHKFEGLGNSPLKLLFFSRIEEKKGLDLLLNSLKSVKISYHLTVAGDGENNYVKRLKLLAANNGLSDHISWIGFQTVGKFNLIQQHDLMILPSHDENFGNVVIESLSMGTPVLISKSVGLADYVASKGLGWICKLDQTEISAYINNISEQKDKRSEIRRLAPTIIRNDFNEASLTEKYISMYRQIIDND